MKKIMLAVAFMVSAMTVNMANSAVSLKSSGDQWGPAVQDLLNSNENGNWNEARFISTFNSRFNGTAEEAKALLASLKAGNGNGNNGGSTCTGNPHDCNSGSGITQEQLDASQKAQDDKQSTRDADQDKHINAVQDASQTANDRATNLEHRADSTEGAIRETNKQLEVTDARSINNAERLDGVETKNAEQDTAIAGKADQSALDKEVTDRQNGDKALQFNIDQNKADQAKTDAKQDKALSTETDNRIAGDNALKANIDQNKAYQAVTDSNQDKVIATKASKKELASETASRKSADAKLSTRIDSNDATLVQHDQRITSNTQRIGSVEGRVSNLEQSTNKRFADVDKRIGDNRKVASAGIAGAGAMANIPGLTQNGNFSIGAGVGGYDGEQAVAVGFHARISQHVTTKVTVSTNTQSEILWGAGLGVEW